MFLLLSLMGNGASESATVRSSPSTHCVGLIGPIATVAAMLLLFCLVTSQT